MEALKAVGLAGVSFDGDRYNDSPALCHSDRLAQDTAKLKRIADQQRSGKKQADDLEEVIRAKLSSLRSPWPRWRRTMRRRLPLALRPGPSGWWTRVGPPLWSPF